MELALRSLSVKGATAMGEGLQLGLDAARTPVPDGLGGTRRLPASIVLLSDGASTRGDDPIDVAQEAKRAGVRVYPIALGTPSGVLESRRADGTIRREPVPPDTLTLQEIARETGGRYFSAPDASKLEAVYSGLATRFSTRMEKQEVTAAFAGGGLLLLVAGLALSLLRGGRLP
jgi:Ca-activated chloride channel family protein